MKNHSMFARFILIFLATFSCSSIATAQTTKYFRHVNYDGQHKYKFRVSVDPKDTATANCYRVEYDKRRPVRWDYLKAGRAATDPVFGFATVIISYEGKSEKHAYYDELGRPDNSSSGDYSEKFTIEKDAESTTLFQYDRIGKLLEADDNGCSRYLFILDDEGRHIKQFCLNDIGMKVESLSGIYETRYTYDEEGNFIEESFLREDGSRATGIARRTMRYDKKDNLVECNNYGPNGEPYTDGAAQIKFSYNAQGYETQRTNFNASGLLISRSEHTYDRKGNMTESRDFGADGELITGTAKMKYDEFNNLIEQSMYSAKSEMYGFSRVSYDTKGRLTKLRFFDADSKPTTSSSGFSTMLRTYDPDGKWTEESYYDEEGSSVFCKEGYAVKRIGWNELGDITALAYFDTEQNLINPPGENGAAIAFEYSTGGKLVDVKYFGPDGERIETEVTTTPPPPRE